MTPAKPQRLADARLQPASQANVRQQNLALLSRLIFETERPPSRADLAAATGLGRATVSRLVFDLISGGIVCEGPPGDSAKRGRPATPLAPAQGTLAGIGLETNVNFIAGRAIDLAGSTLAEFRLGGLNALENPGKMLALLGDSAATMAEGLRASGVRVVGATLAIPGLVNTDDDGLLVAPNLGWTDLCPIAMLGDRWMRTGITTNARNDADLQSLAAAYARPGRTRMDATFLYIAGDIGIGGSLVSAGSITRGNHGWAGEIGHITVDPEGPRCSCGSAGCLEAFAGQAALLTAAGLGAEATADDLLALLESGDPTARRAIERAGWALGIAISDVVNVLDVSRIVFGTSLGRLLPALRAHLERGLASRVIGFEHRGMELLDGPAIDSPACTGGAFEILRGVIDEPAAHLLAPA